MIAMKIFNILLFWAVLQNAVAFNGSLRGSGVMGEGNPLVASLVDPGHEEGFDVHEAPKGKGTLTRSLATKECDIDTGICIPAKSYIYQQGIGPDGAGMPPGSDAIGWFDKGDILDYRVNFGDPNLGYWQIKVHYAKGSSGRLMVTLKDKVTGNSIALLMLNNTGCWGCYRTLDIYISPNGCQHLINMHVIRLKARDNAAGNIDWLHFETYHEYNEDCPNTGGICIPAKAYKRQNGLG